MKIKPRFEVELSDNNQILHIHTHEDCPEKWSALSIQDTDAGHFDSSHTPKVKIIFDNSNLDSIIKALIMYKDNIKTINF